MRQFINQWFDKDDSDQRVTPTDKQKTVFYFDVKTMQSQWLYQNPDRIRFTLNVKWNKVPITICTNLSQKHDYQIPPEKKYNLRHITFLKSNLQKCIRRGLNDKAIKTAYHMIKLNFNEFLRRIAIIVLEDVTLHSSFSTIVWLTAATSSKKNQFKPNKYIIDWLLGLVDLLCNIKEADKIKKDNKEYQLIDLNDYDLLYSLKFRQSYGGMGGDMNMLNYFTGFWLEKFKKDQKCNETEIKLIDSGTVTMLKLDEWKLDGNNCCGVDFHCAPYIIDNLSKNHPYSESELKSVIWNCSSGVNYRKKDHITKKDTEIWDKIKDDYFKEQSIIVNKFKRY